MLNIKSIIYKTKDILDKEGLISLFTRASISLLNRSFSYEIYYLIENSIKDMEADPDDFVPNIPNLNYRFVKTNQEADKVAVEFSDFRLSQHNARERLDKGAMALCIFIGTDFAYIAWAATTKDANKTINDIPFKVNFDNKYVVVGSEGTAPKYRRKGLSTYGHLLLDRFLKDMGVIKKRTAINKTNLISMRAKSGFGNKVYAVCWHIKVFGWELWKEIAISPPKLIEQVFISNKLIS